MNYRLGVIQPKYHKDQQERNISEKWDLITKNNYENYKREEQYKKIKKREEQERIRKYLEKQIKEKESMRNILKKQEQNEHQMILGQLKVSEKQNKQF